MPMPFSLSGGGRRMYADQGREITQTGAEVEATLSAEIDGRSNSDTE
jgi:hypothetical protein